MERRGLVFAKHVSWLWVIRRCWIDVVVLVEALGSHCGEEVVAFKGHGLTIWVVAHLAKVKTVHQQIGYYVSMGKVED